MKIINSIEWSNFACFFGNTENHSWLNQECWSHKCCIILEGGQGSIGDISISLSTSHGIEHHGKIFLSTHPKAVYGGSWTAPLLTFCRILVLANILTKLFSVKSVAVSLYISKIKILSGV